MNANDIIEKCAEIADKWAKDLESAGNQFDHEGDIYRVAGVAQQIANTIRALKSSPITFTPSTGEIRIESMKGGDANEPETLPGLDKSSPGVTAGASPAEKDGGMTEEQIKRLVDRFLQWRLPKNFNPDAGISYKRPNYAPEIDATPSGTNLFDAAQATDMVRFMVEGMPASSLPAETVSEAMVEAARDAFDVAYAAEYIGGALGCRDNKDIALLAALEAALAHADDGWRPIEDAPKDGKAFLASSSGWLTLACWNKNRNGWCCVAPGYPNFPFDEQPTHFMSLQALPAPPKDGRE